MDGRFQDRTAAGHALAARLAAYAGRPDVVVLALPRGGIPVGYEVARTLGVEFDILIVRKLGVPGYPELAMGAIASGGARYLNRDLLQQLGISPHALTDVLEQEQAELRRREALYRGSRPPLDIRGRQVIVVDDGMATGASMRVAVQSLRSAAPARVIVAVPVAPVAGAERFEGIADEFISVLSPADFHAVGQYYVHFDQTSDDEVRALLQRARGEAA
ncbi:MAG TPA: phosphoribosyltransferase family protein [Gammaproteobacteria bacterium]|nr:phosphoribosyltransferase family protein [Gammaproteobacteria bacterium]